MRSFCLSLAAVVLLSSSAGAQPAAAPAANEQQLDFVLNNWEKAMAALSSFSAKCERVSKDKTFGGSELFEGHAKFLKSGPGQPSRALLDLKKKGQPERFERFVCTGTFLYEFVPASKVLRVHDMPAQKPGQVGEENFVTFLFGMKAADAKKRYQMEFVPDAQGQNKWYYYIRILPRTSQDKADFTEARLALTAKDFMVAQLWYHQPNGNELTWQFKDVQVNAAIPLQEFAQPQTPPGWRLERMQANPVPASATAGFPGGKKN